MMVKIQEKTERETYKLSMARVYSGNSLLEPTGHDPRTRTYVRRITCPFGSPARTRGKAEKQQTREYVYTRRRQGGRPLPSSVVARLLSRRLDSLVLLTPWRFVPYYILSNHSPVSQARWIFLLDVPTIQKHPLPNERKSISGDP